MYIRNAMNIDRYICNILLLYIIYIFNYGLIVKFTVFNYLLLNLKTYIPELLLLLIMFLIFFFKKMNFSKSTIVGITYFLCICLINVWHNSLNYYTLYIVRDIYAPFFLYLYISSIYIKKETDLFVNKLIVFSKVYLLFGFILALIEHINGWEWTSSFYTGYVFYGLDPITKIRVAHNMGLLRAPSLSGNSFTFGFYCLFSYISILSNSKNNITKLTWGLIALGCLILSTNKTAFFAMIVIILMNIMNFNNKVAFKRSIGIICSILICIAVVIFKNIYNSDFFYSLGMRIDVWKEIIDNVDFFELIIPYNQFLYTSASDNIFGFWDNLYMYSFFTIGFFGFAILIYIMIINYQSKVAFIQLLILALFIMGFTSNLAQGRGFLTLTLITMPLIARSNSI